MELTQSLSWNCKDENSKQGIFKYLLIIISENLRSLVNYAQKIYKIKQVLM